MATSALGDSLFATSALDDSLFATSALDDSLFATSVLGDSLFGMNLQLLNTPVYLTSSILYEREEIGILDSCPDFHMISLCEYALWQFGFFCPSPLSIEITALSVSLAELHLDDRYTTLSVWIVLFTYFEFFCPKPVSWGERYSSAFLVFWLDCSVFCGLFCPHLLGGLFCLPCTPT